MLYDPKWGDKTALGISLRELIAWLEQQPENGVYDFHDVLNCALAQFRQSKGMSKKDSVVHLCTCETEDRWLLGIAGDQPHTFGAALERARALLNANKE